MGHERAREVRRKGWVVPLVLGPLLLGGTFLFGEELELAPPVPYMGPLWSSPEHKRLPRVELAGPGGSTVFPTGHPCVVHVWLEGCPDCTPAFEAAERLGVGGDRWGVPVHNVAYGQADLELARSRGLAEGLVFDPVGTAIVRPLGIGTFTTLVLDGQGVVRHRDHPQMDGYVSRVTEAVALTSAIEREARGSRPRSSNAFRLSSPQLPTPRWLVLTTAVGGLMALGGAAGGLAGAWSRRLRSAGPTPLRKLGQELALQAGQRCPYCHAGVGGFDLCVQCDGCKATYHEECGRDLGTCSALGCGRAVGAT